MRIVQYTNILCNKIHATLCRDHQVSLWRKYHPEQSPNCLSHTWSSHTQWEHTTWHLHKVTLISLFSCVGNTCDEPKEIKKHTCDQIYNEVLLELEQHIGICDSVQPQFLLIHQLVYCHGKQILLATVAAQNNGTDYPVLPWILLLSNSWKSLHSAVE